MSIQRPTINRPQITKPSISKRKRLTNNLPSLSKKKIKAKITTIKPSIHKKITRKDPVGICYAQNNCKEILSKKMTKMQCRKLGGKSWKKAKGTCENL